LAATSFHEAARQVTADYSHLGGGGAERVIASLAPALDPQHFEIHLACSQTTALSRATPAWITVHRFHASASGPHGFLCFASSVLSGQT